MVTSDMKKDLQVIIAGSRSFDDYGLLQSKCDEILSSLEQEKTITIVSGTASGADRLGERYAEQHNYQIKRYPADWKRFSLSAGPIRNELMAYHAEMLIAFWDGKSRGTQNMIKTARKAGLSVHVIPFTNS